MVAEAEGLLSDCRCYLCCSATLQCWLTTRHWIHIPWGFASQHPNTHTSDGHPVTQLTQDANRQCGEYDKDRSKSFRETVAKYRKPDMADIHPQASRAGTNSHGSERSTTSMISDKY
ncbi:hypothetical protein ETB97_006044 [Aspergillus alliaceus]|uniref:Uncharacterized protein n=1 Tax=Petromyces alliaceus TaxID=209559 RepID=A0A8H5ZVT4_PETAA|nr:hypothetical protein ETB97_006044 [Aspergillus burnettii]